MQKYKRRLHYKHQPTKGKALFDIYKQMSDYDFAASEEDLSLVKEIVSASWGGGYETPVPMTAIYEALEMLLLPRICTPSSAFWLSHLANAKLLRRKSESDAQLRPLRLTLFVEWGLRKLWGFQVYCQTFRPH